MPAPVLSRRLTLFATLALVGSLAAACAKGGDQGAGAKADSATAGAAGAPKTIAIIRAADWIGAEWSEDALRVGLSEEGMEQGRDYVFKPSSAQGDLATLPSLVDAAVDQKAAVIVTLQDETLKSAVERVKDVPIVFHVLSDPFAAGAGTTDSNHAANVTGVYSPGFGDPAQERRVALIKRVAPKATSIGVLFSPGEALSVSLKDKLTSAAEKAGLKVVSLPINNAGEGTEATNALLAKNVGAIEIFGNAAHAAFESIIAAANEKKVPVFSPSPFEIMKGASAAIFPDFQEGGVVAGHMIARILKGESPANIPFYKLETVKEQVAGQ
ncbi:MAG TPA: ABC transporter substrate-binding protein [Gemmatimonadales bacterium]|nr:ABC transporter substrate-binding protein [Gemmatimonadales bacterium]